MKKVRMLFMGTAIMMILSSCGKTVSSEVSQSAEQQIDQVAQKVMNDIDSIGDVSLEDEELINNISEIYKTLTDNQKEQVNNYIDLLNAQDSIVQLKKEQEALELAEREAYLNIEREYYSDIERAIAKLKSECKFPETLKIKEVIYACTGTKSVYISYSAENALGNAVNGYYTYGVDTGVGIDGTDYYATFREVAIGNNSKVPYKIGNDFYAEDEEIGENTFFVFIVDKEDFENR